MKFPPIIFLTRKCYVNKDIEKEIQIALQNETSSRLAKVIEILNAFGMNIKDEGK